MVQGGAGALADASARGAPAIGIQVVAAPSAAPVGSRTSLAPVCRRRRARQQRLGLRSRGHARPAAASCWGIHISRGQDQSFLGDAPDDSGRTRRDGRHDRPRCRRAYRLQSQRRVDAHGLHRQALHAVRVEADPGRSHRLHGRRSRGTHGTETDRDRGAGRRRPHHVAPAHDLDQRLRSRRDAAARSG